MNTKRITLIVVILLLLLITFALFLRGCENNTKQIHEEDMDPVDDEDLAEGPKDQQIFVKSTSAIQGMENTIYLFEDRSFLLIDETGPMRQEDFIGCREGELTPEHYEYLIDYIKNRNFFDLVIEQQEEHALLCEGIKILEATMNGKNNRLFTPCVESYTQETENAINVMNGIREELHEFVLSENEPCRKGIFIISRKCQREYDDTIVSEIDEINDALAKSILKDGRHIYAGPVNETIESFHRKSYEIDGECYFVMLHKFDGTHFKSYDSIV